MIPILYESNENAFSTNGIGPLSDAKSCTIHEERNGEFELTMAYPVTGKRYNDLTVGRLILAKPNETSQTQPFRIYKISTAMSGTVTISAEHISYDLSGIPVAPFSASGIRNALDGLISHSMVENNFSIWTDITNDTTPFSLTAPRSFRACLGGTDGSILDTYSGSGGVEFEFDRKTVNVYRHRGTDRGVSVRYGKNLTDLTMENSIEATYTGVLAYWASTEGKTVSGTVQYVAGHANYPRERIYILDCSSVFTEEPTADQLDAEAIAYRDNNSVGVPRIRWKISFASLRKSAEYADLADLERVRLCDTVGIYFEKLGISTRAEVISTTYNCLTERFDGVELGDPKSDFSSTIRQTVSGEIAKSSSETKTTMQAAIDTATSLISGGMGGHVVIGRNANGQPNEILIMDTDSAATATNVIRMNMGGIGLSTSGYNGPFKLAGTIDGNFNADFIRSGSMSANRVTTGMLATEDGQNYIDLDNNIVHLGGYATTDDIATINENMQETAKAAAEYTDSQVGSAVADLQGLISAAQTKADAAQASDEATRRLLTDYQAEVGQYLNFDKNNGLIIGASGAAMKTQITNDRMAYIYNGQAVAYTSGAQFYVPEIVITGQITIGNYIIKANANGEVTIFKKGT